MTAEEAYKWWKSLMKIDMQVRTDQQMFEIGYNMRNAEVEMLTQLIVDLNNELKKVNKKDEPKRSSKSSKTLQKSSIKN